MTLHLPKPVLALSIWVLLLSILWMLYLPVPSFLSIFSFSSIKGLWREKGYRCENPKYKTEVVSLDPLVVYIDGFVTDREREGVLEVGKPNLQTSQVYLNDDITPSTSRTSESASLAPENEVISCILSRSRTFMSKFLPTSPHPLSSPIPKNSEQEIDELKDLFGTPQLVHYAHKGGKFNLHHDWYDEPQVIRGGKRWNREASFFVWLEDACLGGETWFPVIEAPVNHKKGGRKEGERERKWREHEDGGTAFKAKKGNAIFWNNLHANGTGDWRVAHAGLEIEGGQKSAMNIWPRRYFN